MSIEYNPENLERISKLIIDNLSPDLLTNVYRSEMNRHPLVGYCHTASAALQKIFTKEVISLYRGMDDEDQYHWWNVDKEGKVIDLTADQYYSLGKEPPYENAQKMSMMGYRYAEKVYALLDRLERQLSPEAHHLRLVTNNLLNQ